MTTWRKSTYSADNNGNCVEVGADGPAVLVRPRKPNFYVRRPPPLAHEC